MHSENVEQAELWILAACPPSCSETVEQVERAGLLVWRGRVVTDDMLIIRLSRGLNRAPPECSG